MNGAPAGPEIDALRASVAELFERRVTEGLAPGSFFAVFSPRGIEFEGGFGASVLDGSVPDRGTAFRIASCTKSFTAATLLQLRDRGLLALDSPITDFVPLTQLMGGLPAAVPTVRMLMAMSGGLPTDDPWGDAQESISTSDLTELAAAGVRFISSPGTAYEYSNLGYALLGLVIEAVTGRRYVDVVTEDLLRPLGLKIGFDEKLDAAAVARGYRRSDGRWLELPFSSPGGVLADRWPVLHCGGPGPLVTVALRCFRSGGLGARRALRRRGAFRVEPPRDAAGTALHRRGRGGLPS